MRSQQTTSFVGSLALILLALAGCGGGGSTAPGTTASSAAQAASVVVMIGDSITYEWKSSGDLPDASIIDKGVPGNTTTAMEARFATDVLALQPTVVIILGGTNDISIGDDDRQAVYPTHIFNMAQAAEAAGARVIVGTVPPGKEDTNNAIFGWNNATRSGAFVYGYTLADYYRVLILPDGTQDLSLFNADGIHPNRDGYKKMWRVLASALDGEK